MGGKALSAPIVGTAGTHDDGGYWLVGSDGGIFSFGNAQFYGSMGGKPLNKPIVGMAATPTGGGYWEVASDGGIFAFGSAQFYGSTGSMTLNKPIVGMAVTPDRGWVLAGGQRRGHLCLRQGPVPRLHRLAQPRQADRRHGRHPDRGRLLVSGQRRGHLRLRQRPVLRHGGRLDRHDHRRHGRLLRWWRGLLAGCGADGAVFAFGDAPRAGSMAGQPLNAPIVGITG